MHFAWVFLCLVLIYFNLDQKFHTNVHQWFMYYMLMFQQKMQLKRKKKKEREALGDKVSFLFMFVLLWTFSVNSGWYLYNFLVLFQAPPKEVPKTIENQRVYDETTVDPEDEEVLKEWLHWNSVCFYLCSCFNSCLFLSSTGCIWWGNRWVFCLLSWADKPKSPHHNIRQAKRSEFVCFYLVRMTS